MPNPPINVGMTKKKIISIACAVTIVLYSWSLPNKEPGWPNSARIRRLIEVPNKPDQMPRIKYSVPMSLWLVEKSQRIYYKYINIIGISGVVVIPNIIIIVVFVVIFVFVLLLFLLEKKEEKITLK